MKIYINLNGGDSQVTLVTTFMMAFLFKILFQNEMIWLDFTINTIFFLQDYPFPHKLRPFMSLLANKNIELNETKCWIWLEVHVYRNYRVNIILNAIYHENSLVRWKKKKRIKWFYLFLLSVIFVKKTSNNWKKETQIHGQNGK